ncbi:hypothetical protein GcM1_175012 [Golovinomyces cichoracearum]|uniref:Uncharacterized protein n=1 Tax=Golovinomyces cichoracearum TaxID=62708 RepID=A0A420J5N3_9PEZI|nr:hypothetical protein GcM1_175012 [Golovinomyces cichoracearum]
MSSTKCYLWKRTGWTEDIFKLERNGVLFNVWSSAVLPSYGYKITNISKATRKAQGE